MLPRLGANLPPTLNESVFKKVVIFAIFLGDRPMRRLNNTYRSNKQL